MPPASRIGDNHVCPKVEPGPVPHVGGPILTGESTVLIANKPAARVSDLAQCNAPPDSIKKGSSNVLISNQEAARIGDPTNHGGVVVQGEPTVLIGSGAQSGVLSAASKSGAPFCEECERRKREQQERDAQKREAAQQRSRPPHVSQRSTEPAPSTTPAATTPAATPTTPPAQRQPGALSAPYEDARRPPNTPPSAEDRAHYATALRGVERAVPGLDFSQRSATLRDVLWSTAVQHGGGGATNVFRRALAGTDGATVSDQEIIQRVYAERGAENGQKYFARSTPEVRAAVTRRFANESRDAQEMLLRERAGA
ncbi:MAG: PAAR domain-containing protein [Polyangiales bacterium]